jgi:small subunit ribosomal protein S2
MIKVTDTEKAKKTTSFKGGFGIDVNEMFKSGLQFGHKTSKVHPKMQPYISGSRGGVHILNLEKTAEKLEEALKFMREVVISGGKMVFVGTAVQSKEATKETAIECKQFYVTNRWLGGTFTNFETIKKRIEKFKELEKEKATGELEKYTKKERLGLDKQLVDFEMKFGGIKDLEKMPEAILVLDIEKDLMAVKEARLRGVKIIGIVDTNSNPALVDYMIPANDNAKSAVKYILDRIKEAILDVRPKSEK